MRGILRLLRHWLLRWTAIPAETPAPVPRKRPRRAEDKLGEFHLKTTILDQLEDYFYYLRRMKKGDPESYELYKRIGAHVVPPLILNYFGKVNEPVVPPYWRDHMPSFGCITFAIGRDFTDHEEKTNTICPRFVYFRSYNASGVPSERRRVA